MLKNVHWVVGITVLVGAVGSEDSFLF